MTSIPDFLKLLLPLGVIVICVQVQAQVPFLGACPQQSVVQQFDVNSYVGRWYEIEKYRAPFEADGTCMESFYTEKENGTIGVMNTQISRSTQRMKSMQGTARPIANDGSAKLTVRFPSVPLIGDIPYWVLDTDYKNYSIVWSCTDLMLVNFQIVWFLAREREPSAELTSTVHTRMDELGIRRDLLRKTSQKHCTS